MYRQIINNYNSPEKYSLEEKKDMISGAPYSIIQQHGDNVGNPVHIERYHEDEYIYIYPNHAGDGLIFRDQAMRDQYEGFKLYHNLVYNGNLMSQGTFAMLILAQGLSDENDSTLTTGIQDIYTLTNFDSINFDSFSIDLNSIDIRPGTYVFVYSDEVPNHLRSLSVSLTDNPMSVHSYSIENLSEEIKRLGLTFTVNIDAISETDLTQSLDSVLGKEGAGRVNRIIPDGAGLNSLINAVGVLERTKLNAATLKESKKASRDNAISNINSSFDENTASITQSIENVEADIASYTSQLSQVTKSINTLVQNNPFVLEPKFSFSLIEQRGQLAARTQYANLLSQKTSLQSLNTSSQASLESLQMQLATLSSEKNSQIAAIESAYESSLSEIDVHIESANTYAMIPQSFRFSVPLNCRNSGITKVCIYDHNKNLYTATQIASGASSPYNSVSIYRNDSDLSFYGNGDLAIKSWLMNYAYEDLSSNEDYVSYYSISDRGVKTAITRDEYVTGINSATSSSSILSTKFEIKITPPEVSYLSSGQPEYDFSIIHSTLNIPSLKREIDESKIYANPSIAIDFGENSGTEKTRSLSSANVQQYIQGAYRAVTCFKVKKEGGNSKYVVTWNDSSSKGLNLSKEYLKEKYVPKVVPDSLCERYKALEFNNESIALSSQSSVPEYSFDDGFSIFLVARQNEEFSSDDSGIDAMYSTGDIFKIGYLEMEWPDGSLDSNDILSYEPGYILSNLYQKRNLLYLDKGKSILDIYDVKGIDRQADHLVTGSLSAYSAGKSDAAGYSRANFFEPDSYSILNINYDGSSRFTWYKNGVLLNTSEAVKEFYKTAQTSTLFLGGLKSEQEYVNQVLFGADVVTKISSILSVKEFSKMIGFLLNNASDSALDSVSPDEENTYRQLLESSLENLNQSLNEVKNGIFASLAESKEGSFCGELSEVVIYSGEVSDTVRIKTEGYLAEKFCLEDLLPTDHTWRYDTPPAEEEDEVDPDPLPELTKTDFATPPSYNFTDKYVYTTDVDPKTGEWKPSWLPLSGVLSAGSTYLEQASWDRTTNTLTLHRSGASDLIVDIDIFDTFVTEIFPINGELIPHFSSYISSIFAYPTSSNDEQFSLAPAQKGFFDVLTFHSRSFPDLLWEKNASGDTEIGGKYNEDAVDSTYFTKNTDIRTRSSYVWSGIVNKVGGSTATIRNGQKYYTDSFSNAVSYVPSASPIMVETSMDFNNGYKTTFLKSLNLDCMFTVSRGWDDGDHASNINNFDAVGVRLVTGTGKLYNLAFMISNSQVSQSKFSQIITSEFSGSKIIQGFEPLETRNVSIDISNANNQYIEVEPGEQYSLEFIVYLGKDGQAKLDTSDRPIQSGWFVSNVSFVASDTQK